MDLDPYDQELLGTIMVRLCNCACAREEEEEGVEPGRRRRRRTQGQTTTSGGGGEGAAAGVVRGKEEGAPQPLRHTPVSDSLVLMSEILKGAHVVVDGDKGAFYSWFTQMQVNLVSCLYVC